MNEHIFDAECLICDDTGVTLIEYALVAFLIAVTCVLIITAVGTNLSNLYTGICNAVAAATGGTASC